VFVRPSDLCLSYWYQYCRWKLADSQKNL